MNNTKKEIFIYTLSTLFFANIMWFIGYTLQNKNEENIFAFITLVSACFIPMIVALIMYKIAKTKFRTLKIKPNLKKSWKIYLLAIFISLLIVYTTDFLPLLFFPNDVSIKTDSLNIFFFMQIILYTIISTIESVELLGEELGWMGYLYPRLEKEYGTFLGTFLLSIVRTFYHLVILILIGKSINGALLAILSLFLNNLFLQSILIYVTKKSDSVFPSAIIHGITNILVMFSFITFNEGFDETVFFKLVTFIPIIIIGSIFYILLYKETKLNK